MSISVFLAYIGDDFRHEKTEGFVELGSGDDMIVVAIALEDRRGQLANADYELFRSSTGICSQNSDMRTAEINGLPQRYGEI